jgi:Co/Zn/Cd efflux system component
MTPVDRALRRTVLIVLLLNLGYFAVEITAALRSNSLALFADSADFLEDAAINLLVFFAIGWSLRNRARAGLVLAGLLLVPAAAFVWTLFQKYAAPVPPDAGTIALVGLGALAVNLICALLLARHRNEQGSLTRAAFLSSRNDALANIAIIGVGGITMVMPSIWPDLVVGLGIAVLNIDAAHDVWTAARAEQAEPVA